MLGFNSMDCECRWLLQITWLVRFILGHCDLQTAGAICATMLQGLLPLPGCQTLSLYVLRYCWTVSPYGVLCPYCALMCSTQVVL
jgi:hypothetical protein